MRVSKKVRVVFVMILLGIFFNASFVLADSTQSPSQVAVEFSKAYFKLDPSMKELLSEERQINEDEVDVVEILIDKTKQEAETLGYSEGFMKTGLKNISTRLVDIDDSSATVIVKAERKRSVNCIYEFIGSVFDLGETYEVDEAINLVKEGDEWKITGNPYQLPM